MKRGTNWGFRVWQVKLKSSRAGQAYEALLGEPSFTSVQVSARDAGSDRDVRKQTWHLQVDDHNETPAELIWKLMNHWMCRDELWMKRSIWVWELIMYYSVKTNGDRNLFRQIYWSAEHVLDKKIERFIDIQKMDGWMFIKMIDR